MRSSAFCSVAPQTPTPPVLKDMRLPQPSAMSRTCAIGLALLVLFPLTIRAQSPSPTPGQPESFLPKDLKDWVIMGGTAFTVLGVLFTSWKALAEWHQSTKQRKMEFRHKQAVYAREITKEIFNDPKARAALDMLDWSRKKFKTDEDDILDIRRKQIQPALRAPNEHIRVTLKFSPTEAFIRTRFEALYDRLEELEKLIQLNIVNFVDVETVFRYYVLRIERPDVQHADFLGYYDYPNAKAFLARFTPQTASVTPVTPTIPPPEWLSTTELEDDEIAATETV
jgi:hypothetical protein